MSYLPEYLRNLADSIEAGRVVVREDSIFNHCENLPRDGKLHYEFTGYATVRLDTVNPEKAQQFAERKAAWERGVPFRLQGTTGDAAE